MPSLRKASRLKSMLWMLPVRGGIMMLYAYFRHRNGNPARNRAPLNPVMIADRGLEKRSMMRSYFFSLTCRIIPTLESLFRSNVRTFDNQGLPMTTSAANLSAKKSICARGKWSCKFWTTGVDSNTSPIARSLMTRIRLIFSNRKRMLNCLIEKNK